jgi:hypothetical protein
MFNVKVNLTRRAVWECLHELWLELRETRLQRHAEFGAQAG